MMRPLEGQEAVAAGTWHGTDHIEHCVIDDWRIAGGECGFVRRLLGAAKMAKNGLCEELIEPRRKVVALQ